MSEPTGAPAPTQLSKLTDSELEQEFVHLLEQLNGEQRAAIMEVGKPIQTTRSPLKNLKEMGNRSDNYGDDGRREIA